MTDADNYNAAFIAHVRTARRLDAAYHYGRGIKEAQVAYESARNAMNEARNVMDERLNKEGGEALKDKHGTEIKAGDILRYQETPDDSDYGKSIDEVVEIDGLLYGIKRVGFPRWTKLEDFEPIAIRYYGWFDDTINCVEIIGNVKDNPERIRPEYARILFAAKKGGSK